jgi:hypothetical protein
MGDETIALMRLEEEKDSEGAVAGSLPFKVSVRRAVWIALRHLRYEACMLAMDMDEEEESGGGGGDAEEEYYEELAIRRRLAEWLLRHEEYDAAITSKALKACVAEHESERERGKGRGKENASPNLRPGERSMVAWSALRVAAYCVRWCNDTLAEEMKNAKRGGDAAWAVPGYEESAFSGAFTSAAEWADFKEWMRSYIPAPAPRIRMPLVARE